MSYSSHRISVTTLGDLLLHNKDQRADSPAIIFPDRRSSYGELSQAAYTHARCLHALGIGPGDHVGILMANCIEYLELVAGCAFLGAIAVPINARYKPSELSYVVENADLKSLVTSDLIEDYADFAQLLHEALPGLRDTSDPLNLDLPGAPKLASVVMLGQSRPSGFVSQQQYSELAGTISVAEVERLRVGRRTRSPSHHDVHLRHDSASERLPAQPRLIGA